MSLLHVDPSQALATSSKSFPQAARERASRFRQRGTLHTQHVNGRHIPDPAPVLSDAEIEHLYRTGEPRQQDSDESPFGDTPGDARATRRVLLTYLAAIVSVPLLIHWCAS